MAEIPAGKHFIAGEGARVPFQRGVAKHLRRSDSGVGEHEHIVGYREVEGHQALSDAFRPGAVAAHEYRHIGTQTQTQVGQGIDIEPATPQQVQGMQDGRRIGTGAAQARAGRNAFSNRDGCARPDSACLLQEVCCAYAEIPLHRHARQVRQTLDPHALSGLNHDLVAPVQQLEHGLQVMIAIRAATGDMQEQVQFGRGWPGCHVRTRHLRRPCSSG